MFISLLTFFLLVGPVASRAHEAAMEVRVAQAELAFLDGDETQGLKLLKENLIPGTLHLPSYLMLSQVYMNKGEFSKAFRVYYFLIRRLHPGDGSKLLSLQYVDDIHKYIANIAPPTRQALEIYFLIGQSYFSLAESGHFRGTYNHQLYELSAKYFNLCSHYKYSLPQTNYYLGIVQSRRQLYQKAITHLIEARELFTQENPESDEISNINFLIGDSLVREGYSDAGTLYLKSLYLTEGANDSLREYSKAYLDALAQNYSLITVGMGYTFRENLYRLRDSQRENYHLYEPFLGKEDGGSFSKNLNFFFSSRRFGNFIYTTRFDLREDLLRQKAQSIQDLRSASGALEIKYDNLSRSLIKFSYSYSQTQTRPEAQADFKSYSDDHSFSLQYVHTLKKGTLSYRLPLSLRQRRNFEMTKNLGLGASYVPFYRTRYIAPSFSFEYSLIENEGDIDSSQQMRLSLSNHLRFSHLVSSFIFASVTNTSHPNPSLESTEYSFNIYTNILLPFVTNLSANFSIAQSLANTGNNDKISGMTFSTGFNYSF